MKKAISVIVAVGICIGAWAFLQSSRPNVNQVSKPMTFMEWRETWGSDDRLDPLTPLQLPPFASNIVYASSSVGLGGRAFCYRFSAPLSNMIEYLKYTDLQYTRERSDDDPPVYKSLQIPVAKPKMKPYGLHDLEWFRVDNIVTGFVSHVGGHNSIIWIDAEQHHFYYYWSD